MTALTGRSFCSLYCFVHGNDTPPGRVPVIEAAIAVRVPGDVVVALAMSKSIAPLRLGKQQGRVESVALLAEFSPGEGSW